MHHFLSRRWVVLHLFTLVVVAVCLSLAMWQFRRLDERKAANSRVEARADLPAEDLNTLLPSASAGSGAADGAEYRSAMVRGTYDVSEEVVLQSRGFKERPGNHLLTPLVTSPGEAILVDRGWVPLPTPDAEPPDAAPPSGPVNLTGYLLPSERKGLFGVSDPPPGQVTSLARIDIDRLGDQLPYRIHPLYLRLQEQTPANAGKLPEPVPLPPPDDGPHFEYAMQWLLFAGMAVIIYIGLIRRELARERQDADERDPVAAEQ